LHFPQFFVLYESFEPKLFDDSPLFAEMFALLARTTLNPSCEFDTDCVNTINTWAEPRNANGLTSNTIIDSNDEPAGNNQQRIGTRGY
jgi:hypothetical protein